MTWYDMNVPLPSIASSLHVHFFIRRHNHAVAMPFSVHKLAHIFASMCILQFATAVHLAVLVQFALIVTIFAHYFVFAMDAGKEVC